jgi:cytochrome P450
VQRNFTPRYVRNVEAAIPRVIETLLAQIDPTKPVDIIGSFSAPFAAEIMAELIGLPSDRRGEVAELIGEYLRSADPACPFDLQRAGALAARKHRDYIREIAADRRAAPVDDFVNVIIHDPQLAEPEKITLMQTLYIGGYGTTAHMIGNGLVLLLKNPDQFEKLKQDRSLLKSAVEEMLRLDGAISLSRMLSLEDTTLAGTSIPAGRYVSVLLVAANRDPEVFPDPDKFDILREGKPHLSFAAGRHFCLGVYLARLELERAFDHLISHFPNMRLADEHPPRSPTFHQQSFEKVMVLLEPTCHGRLAPQAILQNSPRTT